MKRVIFILTLVIITSHQGWSQNNKFQIGIDGGPSISGNTAGSSAVSFQSIKAFSVSSTFQVNFNSKWAIVYGLGFEKKGYEMKAKPSFYQYIGEKTYLYDMNYVNLPVMFRLSLGQNKFKFFGNFGGYLGFNSEVTVYMVDEPGFIMLYTKTRYFEEVDFGISFGLGLSYALTDRFCLSFETRNNYGLVYLSSSLPSGDRKSQLNTTNFLFGINYGFGAK